MKRKRFIFGFTLIETVIATAIVLAIAAVVFQLLVGGQMFYGTGEAKMQAQEWTRIVLNRMVQELREAAPAVVYIRNSAGGGAPPTQDSAIEPWEGDSVLFQRPCRYGSSGAIMLYNDPDDAEHEMGDIIYGAQDANGDWQEGLWIEYSVIDINDLVPAPAPPGPGPGSPPGIIIWPKILLSDACAQDKRLVLARRVWHAAFINTATLVITAGVPPVKADILSTAVETLTFCTDTRTFPARLEITVEGRGRNVSRIGEEQISRATSQISFRN